MKKNNEKIELLFAKHGINTYDFCSIAGISIPTVNKIRFDKIGASNITLSTMIKIYKGTEKRFGKGWSPWMYIYNCPNMSDYGSLSSGNLEKIENEKFIKPISQSEDEPREATSIKSDDTAETDVEEAFEEYDVNG